MWDGHGILLKKMSSWTINLTVVDDSRYVTGGVVTSSHRKEEEKRSTCLVHTQSVSHDQPTSPTLLRFPSLPPPVIVLEGSQ
ncbi:hypothetical protein CEXT_75541 [Caerostris extrusa]|uniref:Uncharacterized protein n=1 Tax=Caerostris extrusa TaxID=172846 RepID=A0AAV4XVT3_CAEEX|nr:hypothetical protein CEXT_75541 [Caerostris extrusa]